jgi:cysteine desulfurase
MESPPIYLDCNATAPMLPEVVEAMRDAALRFVGNPASQHEFGRQARRAVEAARERIGQLLGARTTGLDADQVIFTSGGTEANNLALRGLLQRAGASPPPAVEQLRGRAGGGDAPARRSDFALSRLAISAIEHPSVARTAEKLQSDGVFVEQIPVDRKGILRLDAAEDVLSRSPSLVSVMLANNETGAIQPIAELVELSRHLADRAALVHTDATQAVGKTTVDFASLGVDALTCTAHKLHGPLGVGALILRHGVPLAPQLMGGFQQAALRPGTESAPLAVGFAAALEAWHAEAAQRELRMRTFRDRLERQLLEGDAAAVVIAGEAPRLPHTSNVAFVGLDRQALAIALDLAGVACSTGSACASGSSEPSPTLLAMGLEKPLVDGSLRFSLGALTTAAEIDEAARRILLCCKRLRRQ